MRTVPLDAALQRECYCTYHHSNHNHGMQTYESALEKFASFHRLPTVVVGVTNHETRQDEKEINGEIAVIEMLVNGTCSKSLKHMIPYHHECRYTSQSVKKRIVGFGVGKRGRRYYGHVELFFVINDSQSYIFL